MTDIPEPVSGALVVQYQDGGGNWVNFGLAHDLGSIKRTRRFGGAPGQSITARYWRIIKTGATDWGATLAQVDVVRFWAEGATPTTIADLNQVRLRAFNFDDDDQRYILPVTPGNYEVYRQSVQMTPVPAPHTGDQLLTVTGTQLLDTMITFHTDIAPQRVMRQGGHQEWDSRNLSFDALPLYDYTGKNAGGVNEVQQLMFVDYVAGDTFNITLEGETTNAIVWAGVGATDAASIQAALVALPSVGAGQVTVASLSTTEFQATFAGTDAASPVGQMAPVTLSSTAGGVSVAMITQGVPGGEPIISAARGWPACGTFYQQRLYMGGLKGRPQTILGSRLGSYFNFSTKGANADGALNETLDTDEVTAIRNLYSGRHLQVFTSSAEFYFPTEPIEPPAAIKLATRRGCSAGTPQVTMDGQTLFLADGAAALASFEFTFYQDTYQAPFLSVLASHLLGGPPDTFLFFNIVDMGFRKARSTSQSDLALLIRSDGAATVLAALRDQDVTGFAPWTTQGRFLASVGEMGGDIYVVTARQAQDGSWRRYLERMDYNRVLDCSLHYGAGDDAIQADNTIAVPWPDGEVLQVYIDGGDGGDVTVAAGKVQLPFTPLHQVEVGYGVTASGTTLPGVLQQDTRGGASMRPRTGIVDFRLGPSTRFKAGQVGGRLYQVKLTRRPNALLDQGDGQAPFFGWTRLFGIPGFRSDAQVTWFQDRPGTLQIEEIVVSITS